MFIKRRGAYKLPIDLYINWAHPLATGLMGGILLNEGGGLPLEFSRGGISTFTTSKPIWRGNSGGLGLFFDLTNTQAVTIPMPVIPTTAPGQSYAFCINVATEGGANSGRIITNGTSDNAPPQVQWSTAGLSTISIQLQRSIANPSCTTSGANIVANKDCHIVITDDQSVTLSPNMYTAYFNGVSASLTAGSNALGTILDPTSLTVGGLASTAPRSIDGTLYYFYKYARVLTQVEALWLMDEPDAFIFDEIPTEFGKIQTASGISPYTPLMAPVRPT